MTGAGSRAKGSRGELEFAAALADQVGVKLARRLTQVRGGGHDLELPEDATGPVAESLAALAIEIKRHSSVTPGSLATWWSQACRQAEDVGLLPCLAYRPDRQPWRVRLPLACVRPDLFPVVWADDALTVDMGLPAFAALVREGAICPRGE